MEAERKQRILEATEDLLQRYGPAKTTMADIAKAVGVAVGSIYLAFDSKEAIVEELSSRKHDGILAAMRAAVKADRPADERVRAFFDARLDGWLEVADCGHHGPDLVSCQLGAVKSAHERFLTAQEKLLVSLLEEGAKSGELQVTKPEASAKALLATYARFSAPWVYKAPREETRALLRSVHDLVLFGLVRRKRR
jgi:AcrR family transcriptional regulator